MRSCLLAFLFIAFLQKSDAQLPKDTSRLLSQHLVTGYLTEQPLLNLTVTAGILDSTRSRYVAAHSPVGIFNTVPGVRMEERSPGSYRLSMRGSLLRSPFGIRNIKIYLDEFPLTDAGGNTYLNLIDLASAPSIEFLKGPNGSIFGANSGGVISIRPYTDTLPEVSGMLSGGSYGLFREQVMAKNTFGKNSLKIFQSYQRSEGYRDQSAMQRLFIHAENKWQLSETQGIRLLAFFSDLHYETPGGLTPEQYRAQPYKARFANATLPGAEEQKAGIYNKTIYGGLLHDGSWIGKRLQSLGAVFASYTDFKNPFITNFEKRNELTYGARHRLILKSSESRIFQWDATVGVEFQNTHTSVRNFDNNKGMAGALQSKDSILTTQYFFFARFSTLILKRFTIEAALSANGYRYSFGSGLSNDFGIGLMPRFALNYAFNGKISIRASVSRGYSPPTTAEIRPSDATIYAMLLPESGWSYETGIRATIGRRIIADAAVFYYALEQAIVRRQNDDGTEYFANAGGTSQGGLEADITAFLIQPGKGIVSELRMHGAYTVSLFYFHKYVYDNADFSGNRLTGVPGFVAAHDLLLRLRNGLYFFAEYNYTSSIPLNDANTENADPYHLVRMKFGWTRKMKNNWSAEPFIGIDNLLNQRYSLGNDLNAAGNRYYNAAAPLNFYAGLSVRFIK